jgi:hypothetical protein
MVVQLKNLDLLSRAIVTLMVEYLANHLARCTSTHLDQAKALLVKVYKGSISIACEGSSRLNFLLILPCLEEEYYSTFNDLDVTELGYLLGSSFFIRTALAASLYQDVKFSADVNTFLGLLKECCHYQQILNIGPHDSQEYQNLEGKLNASLSGSALGNYRD